MAQVFPLAVDQGSKTIWGAVIIVPICALMLYLMLAPRLLRFEVRPKELRISGDPLYGRTIPLTDLDMSAARAIDLATSSDYRLSWRTNGVGLPHFKSGWFRLAGGGKALVFIGDPHRTVVIPHREGYSLMVSPSDPEAFLNSLRSSSSGMPNQAPR
jgi:Bacterial PH domain